MTARSEIGPAASPAMARGSAAERPERDPLPPLPPGARDLRELPLERYQRLRLAADVLRRLFEGRPARVLVSPTEKDDLAGLLLGEAFDLVPLASERETSLVPYDDGRVDAVLRSDGLSALPREGRERFLRDAARLVRGAVVVVGAFRVEQRGIASLLAALGNDPAEAAVGARSEVERALAAGALEVACIGHGAPARALALACASAHPGQEQLARDANEPLYRADPRAPFLRHAVIGWRSGVATGWLAELAACVEGSRDVSGFELLLAERLERLRAAGPGGAAAARVREIERTLELERAQARQAAEEAWEEFASLRQELAQLRTLAIREVSDARCRLEAERDARHALADRLVEREEVHAEQSERQRQRLLAIQAEHRAQLAEARAEREASERLLRAARGESERLRGELSDRWRNLLRFLRPPTTG